MPSFKKVKNSPLLGTDFGGPSYKNLLSFYTQWKMFLYLLIWENKNPLPSTPLAGVREAINCSIEYYNAYNYWKLRQFKFINLDNTFG